MYAWLIDGSTLRGMMRWLIALWFQMIMPSFFGLGEGPSPQEQQQYGELGSLANFATSEGEGDIGQSDAFFKAILSGDPSKISQYLGPAISAVNKSGQQQKLTLSQFGNRGGGTNAAAQNIDDSTRSSIDQMISELTGKSASALGASGSGLLAAGVNAHEGAFSEANTIQQQHSAQLNDLFKSIASVAAAPFTGGSSLGFGNLSLPGGSGGNNSSLSWMDPGTGQDLED
jgi:hypothetical protein